MRMKKVDDVGRKIGRDRGMVGSEQVNDKPMQMISRCIRINSAINVVGIWNGMWIDG